MYIFEPETPIAKEANRIRVLTKLTTHSLEVTGEKLEIQTELGTKTRDRGKTKKDNSSSTRLNVS